MKLNDLMPLDEFNQKSKSTFRRSLSLVLNGELEVYYGFTSEAFATYESIEDCVNGLETPEKKRLDYEPADAIKVPLRIIKELWGKGEAYLDHLLDESAPEGFGMIGIIPANNIIIKAEDLFVKQVPKKEASVAENNAQANLAALKVIGLMMWDLANDKPSLMHGERPNREQIRNHLLKLAERYEVDSYGLSKSHEGILKQAMEYVAIQPPQK